MKKITIIIITYNRVDDTLDLLKDISFFEYQNLLAEVIVLNNRSTANYSPVSDFINTQKTNLFQFVEAAENLGVARGRNFAATYATGGILFFVDDDVNLKDKNTLCKIMASFDNSNFPERPIGVVSYKVIYSANSEIQLSAFPNKNYYKYKNKSQFLAPYYVGCAHAKLKQAWDLAGDYPSDFFYGMEEYDFSYRLLNAGYSIKYDDSLIVIHKESPLGRQKKTTQLKMMWVNKSVVAWKYLPIKYFYTTRFLWGCKFLFQSKFNFKLYLEALKEIKNKITNCPKSEVNLTTLEYLSKVDARLWY